MLVELGLVEQRYRAVMEVLDGAAVKEVALRNGVVRQTVHWLGAPLLEQEMAYVETIDGPWGPTMAASAPGPTLTPTARSADATRSASDVVGVS